MSDKLNRGHAFPLMSLFVFAVVGGGVLLNVTQTLNNLGVICITTCLLCLLYKGTLKFSKTVAMLCNQISPNRRDASKPVFKKRTRRFLFETLSNRDG